MKALITGTTAIDTTHEPVILLVDDTASGLEALTGTLAGEGYRLETASDGLEALEKAVDLLPDLILLDIMMPGMDGYEVCRRLRRDERTAEVPVIMVTALDERDSLIAGVEAGADDFVSKPFDRTILRARVRTVTRLNRFRRLLGEREKVDRLVSLSPDGILVVRADAKVLVANAAIELTLAVENGALIGATLWDFVNAEERASCGDCLHQVIAEQIPSKQLESVFVRSGGIEFPVEISVGYCAWDEQPACELVVRDVSDRKRLEAEIQRTQRLDAIGRTVSAVAHDFGNYLAAIRANVDLLKMDIPEGSDERQSVDEIAGVTEKATELTRQLMTFARKRQSTVRVLDLNAVVQGLEAILDRIVGRKVRLNIECAPGAWRVKGDSTQIEQVIVNLVVNARDATPDGGTITLQTARVQLDERYVARFPEGQLGGHIQLTVADTGHGMDEDTKTKAFEPFFTTKEPDKGTGLGLATVYGIVKQHHGHIRIESELGNGATFHVYLPEFVESPPSASAGG